MTLAKFNRDLERFVKGLADEFVSSDGTTYRRLREQDGEKVERRSSDGGRAVFPFSEVLKAILLATAQAESVVEVDEIWKKTTGRMGTRIHSLLSL